MCGPVTLSPCSAEVSRLFCVLVENFQLMPQKNSQEMMIDEPFKKISLVSTNSLSTSSEMFKHTRTYRSDSGGEAKGMSQSCPPSAGPRAPCVGQSRERWSCVGREERGRREETLSLLYSRSAFSWGASQRLWCWG